jgi:hypothetical protein
VTFIKRFCILTERERYHSRSNEGLTGKDQIAYTVEEKDIVSILLAGNHENFYLELKRVNML